MSRARDLGIPLDGETGPSNSITDVKGVQVGHSTLIDGNGKLKVGQGPVRTGVTAILPRGKVFDPVFAGWYALNGNGEMTGTAWMDESGLLETPILITNTQSVGLVRDAVVAWMFEYGLCDPNLPVFWSLPLVAETSDGRLNDANGNHIRPEHVFAALDNASTDNVQEGNVGGGTGMVCYQFKGGIGTASRKIGLQEGGFTVGALVQSNYGAREHLVIAGVPVGREISDLMPVLTFHDPQPGSGSIIVVIATDAPLLPHQLKRLARRVPLGIARVGGIGANNSGDIFVAFSTANSSCATRVGIQAIEMLPNDEMNPLFEATIQATEEAIINSLVAAETMQGINGNTAFALPHDRLQEVLKKYNRLDG